MQTNTWLTGTPYPEECPLCSEPLPAGSNVCQACGFTAHELAHSDASQKPLSRSARQSNPITPIPARASAQRGQSLPGNLARRARTTDFIGFSSDDEISEEQSTNRHYSSPTYEAASSLSALSLIIAETPTVPPRTPQQMSPVTARPLSIDEMETVPPPVSGKQVRSPQSEPGLGNDVEPIASQIVRKEEMVVSKPASLLPYIDEIATVPERQHRLPVAEIPTVPEKQRRSMNAASWSARSLTTSTEDEYAYTQKFHLLDKVRWWLLRPGHIEFSFWLIGALLLVGITFLLLLAGVLSVVMPDLADKGNSSPTIVRTVSASSGTSVTEGTSGTLTATATISVPATQIGDTYSANQQPGQPKDQGNTLLAQLSGLNPLIWLVGACYFLSMVFLGSAAFLRKRQR